MTDSVERYYRVEQGPVRHRLPSNDAVVEITVHTFAVVKHTRAGVWLHYGPHLPRDPAIAKNPKKEGCTFVLNGARKRFAYPTIDAALKSFIIRKQRQIAYAQESLVAGQASLAFAKQIQEQAHASPDVEATLTGTIRLKSGEYRGPGESLDPISLWDIGELH